MKKYFFIILIFASSLYSQVGGANGIELTDSEKLIFENRRNIMKLNLKLSNLKDNVDGIKSILDSMGDKIVKEKKSPKNDFQKQIDKLSDKVDAIDKESSQRFERIESSIEKLLNLLSKKSTVQNLSTKVLTSKKSKKIKILSAKQIYKKAISSYKNKKYKEAIDYFLDLVDKKYKLATSYFYIAESLYNQKRYKDAIHYYKKSVNENDKSSFLATLLLHTGISFKNSGDKVGAKRFFNSLIGAYPKSSQAKEAKNYLKKL